ncbi:alpha/beta hydrolase [Rhodococcus sp. HM1]|uniref:alpha/beta fold hydrolase n=1 Tax=unclassified Rhodococcus (in: high G+C Gram-positive bacteria) TaxID=192944 RepID=UPI0018CEEF5C|nr:MULTISPECIES: alpha/beta hydrolase [unclassified Rhodococcus (in: high G+C Gram-positive bacteria)]MBH0119782.1 alpha/beta hydrolase [Rhodococcus sp. CX]MCK8672807.1 alpha/beta hydrolase [Rhodococcus sp. HM1]
MPVDTPLPQHVITGDGPTTVFLLHGAYGDGRYFDHTRDVLVDAGYRVVVWDCPGYAGTPIPQDSSIDAHAHALADLVAAVGGERNVLLGHSMGGLIAPHAANLIGDRVHGLVLSHTSPGLNTFSPEDQARFIAERIDPIEDGRSVAEYAPELLVSMMREGASGPLVQRVVDVICAMSTDTFKASMRAIVDYDGVPALRSVAVPTLVIAGELDSACPPAGLRRIHELVTDSEYHELSGVGHYGFAEEPEKYERIVIRFLADLTASAH